MPVNSSKKNELKLRLFLEQEKKKNDVKPGDNKVKATGNNSCADKHIR